MSKRKAGWYWVKWPHEKEWFAARYMGRVRERHMWSSGDIIQSDAPSFIGPRIPTPDEPWQCAPVKATEEMVIAYMRNGGDVENADSDWQTMLAAAPKPEDT